MKKIRRNYVLCNQQKSMTTNPNDYMYDFNHKLLLWILCKIHSHILMGHVINRWWSGSKMESVKYHHFYFIYMAFMTNDKKTWTFNCYYNDFKWLQIIDMNIDNPTPPLNLLTCLSIYLPTNIPTYQPPPIYLPTHSPTYLPL